jgi:hypothetical protein
LPGICIVGDDKAQKRFIAGGEGVGSVQHEMRMQVRRRTSSLRAQATQSSRWIASLLSLLAMTGVPEKKMTGLGPA